MSSNNYTLPEGNTENKKYYDRNKWKGIIILTG